MEDFASQLRLHAAHVAEKGHLCTSEETTKQALILPVLMALGFSPFDPQKVQAEYQADLSGVKRTERVDYALFSEDTLAMFVEAKAFEQDLNNHAPQLARYFNATPGVCVAALTNGRFWKFFTDLEKPNIMDDTAFFVVDFMNLHEHDIDKLARFRYGVIQADTLRTVAEDLLCLAKFQEVIETSLRDPDADFVRFVANKSLPSTRITPKTMDSTTILVKRAVNAAVSRMVVHSLSPVVPTQFGCTQDAACAQVDPSNPRVVTTPEERRLAEVARDLLKGRVDERDLLSKDMESYFTVLYQGKNNRWLLRYNVNRKRPTVQFPFALNDQHRGEAVRAGMELTTGDLIFIDSPLHLLRLSGLLFDALDFVRNDENFKRPERPVDPCVAVNEAQWG